MADFRSDTVTKPTERMRKAMAEAEVGDDVFGDDPTVISLQEKVAQLFEKDAALFVPSGTMGNQVAIKTHTKPGDEIIVEESTHIYNFESGGAAFNSGVQAHPVRGKDGILNPQEVKEAIRPKKLQLPRTGLICVENTHNISGGRIVPLENLKEIRKISLEEKIPLHLDGARIFNASVATGIPVSEYARYADSVMFCFSKGLGCPVGSILTGDYEFIEQARWVRKAFGGGMRQVGVIAACGLVALEEMIERLVEDHRNAKALAEGLASINRIEVFPEKVETNIVMVRVKEDGLSADSILTFLREEGILAIQVISKTLRFVTHKDVDEQDVKRGIEVMGTILH
ncbi:low-specificity L-threonine aldolase [candidate division TA06 bacterium]|nr:low-specificity L-threonine aldolase [candidate division TA06 bacterium]